MAAISPTQSAPRPHGGEPRRFTPEEFERAVRCALDPAGRYELRDGLVYDAITGKPHCWNRGEYYRALDCGLFVEDEKYELLEGEILHKMGQSRAHVLAVLRCTKVFERAFGEGYYVQPQMPVQVNRYSEPEPDILVVRGAPEDYEDHPTTDDTVLLVEVSDTSLSGDRNRKARIYASRGVADYWIVNVPGRRLEVMRDPEQPARGAARFRTTLVVEEGGSIAPLAAPGVQIEVATLLPPRKQA